MIGMDAELQYEQQRVDTVREKLSRRLADLKKELGDVKSHMVEIRRHFWDEVTVNIDHADDVAETISSIRQQVGVLKERERRHEQTLKEYNQLEKLYPSPYFGRIDLTEDDTGEQLTVYIGTCSFIDDDGETFLVYDWRAPISSVYYDYPPGPISYETPVGIVTGKMDLKRQFIIRDGIIRSMFDTGETIGDELLQQVLGQNADLKMKSIVATIQKEQNQVIRNDRAKLLVVRGAAGSGKTSAALQRVAYLLYKYRNQINADQIVLFSPNPIFNSYVSTVLPELGEENMQQTTFQEYLERRIGSEFDVEDPYDQMEYVLTAPDSPEKQNRIAAMKFKGSVPFLDIIRSFTDSLEEEGLEFRDLKFNGEAIITAREMRAIFNESGLDSPLRKRVEELREWLLEGLKKAEKDEMEKPWVEDEIELLDQEEIQKAFRYARKQSLAEDQHEHDIAKQWLKQKVVRERFKPLRRRIKRFGFIHLPRTYANLYKNPDRIYKWMKKEDVPDAWPGICRLTLEALSRKQLLYEDATPYLYLKERLFGFSAYNSVRHVIVDEGQDYSPLQFEFLKRLFPRSKMTVLGDFNQAIHVHADGLDFTALNQLYGEAETEHIRLSRSYRSTQQIVRFTRDIVPDGEEIIPFHRDGAKPTITTIMSESELIRCMVKRLNGLSERFEEGTIAVICKTEQECEQAYAALTSADLKRPLQKVTKESRRFEKGIQIIPSYLAKGVEFDAVIVYNVSRHVYGSEFERKLLYTVCTRAMHELHLYAIGELSPFLANINPELYVDESSIDKSSSVETVPSKS
jgi:DNA helicase-2/ATP-dependent DNA helicase PcrA